jgi:hypothetical protein
MFFKVKTYVCLYYTKRNIFVEVNVSDPFLLPTWPWVCLKPCVNIQQDLAVCDYRIPPRSRRDLSSSGILHSIWV